MQRSFVSSDLQALFAQCFLQTLHTELVGGAEEPFYQPASDLKPAQIFYTKDYFRSALHEIAHWCVAGPERRLLADFGYWYAADGRNAEQQAEFLKVEVKPQALELLFCAAAGHRFRVSLDNLTGEAVDAAPFEQAVLARVEDLLEQGLPDRVLLWCEQLMQHYRGASLSFVLLRDYVKEVFEHW
jgi:hypothetical protein